MSKSAITKLLIALLLFQAISALGGGIVLILEPSGSTYGFDISMLNNTFPDFLIPGLFLFIVLGVLPLIVFFGMITRFRCKTADRLRLFPKQHWSWNLTAYIGVILVMWILIQVVILASLHIFHLIYLLLGLVLILLTQLDVVKRDYRLS